METKRNLVMEMKILKKMMFLRHQRLTHHLKRKQLLQDQKKSQSNLKMKSLTQSQKKLLLNFTTLKMLQPTEAKSITNSPAVAVEEKKKVEK